MEYVKAAIASGGVALLLVTSLSFISSGGRIYLPDTDWKQINHMNYKDAQQYLMKQSKRISRWESLINGLSEPAFWLYALSDWVLYFLVGFISCVFYQRISQSNTSFKSDRADCAAL